MTTTTELPTPAAAVELASGFLEAFVRRDFGAMPEWLTEDCAFRGLIPPGLVEGSGPAAVVERFETWFGRHERFVVVDATVGHIGERPFLRWRVEVGEPDAPRVAEQQLYLRVADRISAIDLLCSGFQDGSLR